MSQLGKVSWFLSGDIGLPEDFLLLEATWLYQEPLLSFFFFSSGITAQIGFVFFRQQPSKVCSLLKPSLLSVKSVSHKFDRISYDTDWSTCVAGTLELLGHLWRCQCSPCFFFSLSKLTHCSCPVCVKCLNLVYTGKGTLGSWGGRVLRGGQPGLHIKTLSKRKGRGKKQPGILFLKHMFCLCRTEKFSRLKFFFF